MPIHDVHPPCPLRPATTPTADGACIIIHSQARLRLQPLCIFLVPQSRSPPPASSSSASPWWPPSPPAHCAAARTCAGAPPGGGPWAPPNNGVKGGGWRGRGGEGREDGVRCGRVALWMVEARVERQTERRNKESDDRCYCRKCEAASLASPAW